MNLNKQGVFLRLAGGNEIVWVAHLFLLRS